MKPMPKHNIALVPGSMGIAALAIDLFGIERIMPGRWTTPVFALEVSDDETEAARELLEPHGVSIRTAMPNEWLY